MLKKCLKSLVYLSALAFLSTLGAFFLRYAVAAWTPPTSNPPADNISTATPTLQLVTDQGNTTSGSIRADSGYYINSDVRLYRDDSNRLRTDDYFYVHSTSLATYLYSTDTYLGADSGDTIHTRGNVINIGANSTGQNGDLRVINYTANAVSDGIKFYEGGTRVGEIGVEDTSWLRINQETATNIYTPRMLRADGGLQLGDDEGFARESEDLLRTLGDSLSIEGDAIVDGNLNIGTTANADTDFYLKAADISNIKLNFGGSTDNDEGQIMYRPHENRFYFTVNAATAGGWDTTGLGIGTISPSVALDVVGDITASGDICSSGGTICLDSIAGGIGTPTLQAVTDQGNTTTNAVTISSTVNPGLTVGNGSTGYLKVGSTGWYDDGAYFSTLGTRPFYIRSDHTYLGASSGDTIYTRGNVVNIGANSTGQNGDLRVINYTANAVSDGIKFYEGGTRVGEIGVEDTSWLRINQETNTNIYTPRMFRADGGLQVNDDEGFIRESEDVIRTLGDSLNVEGSLEVNGTISDPDTSYVTINDGLYVSNGTFYAQYAARFRGEITNDNVSGETDVYINDWMDVRYGIHNDGAYDSGNVYINDSAHISGALTVDGNLTVAGQSVCRADGTNCPAGSASTLQTVTDAGNTTTLAIRADGGFQVDSRTVIDASGQYHYGTSGTTYGRFGQVDSSSFGVDATNDGDWNFLVSEGMTFTPTLNLGYNGLAVLTTYDTNEDLNITPNGTGDVIVNADVTVNGQIQGGGADMAERFSAREQLNAGTVVVMGEDGYRSVRASVSARDKLVLGVVSENAGLVMGEAQGPHTVIVALIGVVPVKVTAENGSIERGDLLTTSAMVGHAMKADNSDAGAIIGKALEDFSGMAATTGVIQVMVNLQ